MSLLLSKRISSRMSSSTLLPSPPSLCKSICELVLVLIFRPRLQSEFTSGSGVLHDRLICSDKRIFSKFEDDDNGRFS